MAALLKRNETRSVIQNGAFLIKEGILIKESECVGFWWEGGPGSCPRHFVKDLVSGKKICKNFDEIHQSRLIVSNKWTGFDTSCWLKIPCGLCTIDSLLSSTSIKSCCLVRTATSSKDSRKGFILYDWTFLGNLVVQTKRRRATHLSLDGEYDI